MKQNTWNLISVHVRLDSDEFIGEFYFPECCIPQVGDWVTLKPNEKPVQVVIREIDAFDEEYNQDITLWVSVKSRP